MRGSGLLAGVMIGAVALLGVSAPAAAAPDPYSPSVTTSCRINVPAVVEPGKKFAIRVSVRANSPTEPKGLVRLWITSAGGGTVWEKSVPYNGGTKRVNGPALTQGDDYEVGARFRPRGDGFAECRGSVGFDVQSQDEQRNPDGDGDDEQGGLLPDTGGPALMWLLIGLALVAGGSAIVVYSRRRTPAATV